MAPSHKRKRESTAAYAASQPLFDALRIATTKIGEQEAELTQARDLVQNIHVKITNIDNQNNAESHERYAECAVKAWRSALDTYTDIFNELVTITAPDASEGRDAADGHHGFKAIAESVAAAKDAAARFRLHAASKKGAAQSTKAAKHGRVTVNDDEEIEEEDEFNDGNGSSNPSAPNPYGDSTTYGAKIHANGVHASKRPLSSDTQPALSNGQPAQKIQKLSEDIRDDKAGHKLLWEKGAENPNVPYETLGSSEKKAWQAEKGRQTRGKKAAKRAHNKVGKEPAATGADPSGTYSGADQPGPNRWANGLEDMSQPAFQQDYTPLDLGTDSLPISMAVGKENKIPGVQYEDVSAEVEARLKAKEERKKAKKAEKKRKRESGDSSVMQAAAERPQMKRVKAAHVTEGVTSADKAEKRKQEAENAGQGPKKRKKTKA